MLPLETLRNLLANEVTDLRDASSQWSRTLPKWAKRASHQALATAFWDQHAETEGQIARLELIADTLGLDAQPTRSAALGVWLIEADRGMHAGGAMLVIDAALIASARQVGYWLTASYGSAKSLAALLGLDGTAAALGDSLSEVAVANRTLESIADARVHPAALLAEMIDHGSAM